MKGELFFEDVICYLIVIDEVYRIVNMKKGSEYVLDFLMEFSWEVWKYFVGLIYVSYLIIDFVFEGFE